MPVLWNLATRYISLCLINSILSPSLSLPPLSLPLSLSHPLSLFPSPSLSLSPPLSPSPVESLAALASSLLNSSLSPSHVPVLFYMAGIGYHWIKEGSLFSSQFKSGELLLLQVQYVIYIVCCIGGVVLLIIDDIVELCIIF